MKFRILRPSENSLSLWKLLLAYGGKTGHFPSFHPEHISEFLDTDEPELVCLLIDAGLVHPFPERPEPN